MFFSFYIRRHHSCSGLFAGKKGRAVSLGNLDCQLVFCGGFVQQLEKTFDVNFYAMKTSHMATMYKLMWLLPGRRLLHTLFA